MKIRLNVSDERYAELEQKLLSAGFEIDDEAELIITEKERYSSFIAVKNKKGEKLRLKSEEIIFIESFGHDVVIHSTDGEAYFAYDRLYQLCAILDTEKFLRVFGLSSLSELPETEVMLPPVEATPIVDENAAQVTIDEE